VLVLVHMMEKSAAEKETSALACRAVMEFDFWSASVLVPASASDSAAATVETAAASAISPRPQTQYGGTLPCWTCRATMTGVCIFDETTLLK
jgi:hypothetical protein